MIPATFIILRICMVKAKNAKIFSFEIIIKKG